MSNNTSPYISREDSIAIKATGSFISNLGAQPLFDPP